MYPLSSLASTMCLASTALPGTMGAIITQLESQCRERLIADIPTSPYLDDYGRRTLQQLVDSGASTRRLADATWFSLFAAQKKPTLVGLESLFDREPGVDYEREVNSTALREVMSERHFMADQVMKLTFPDEAALAEFYWNEQTALPYFRLLIGFSWLFLETPMSLVHDSDQDKVILRVPSLTLIESAYRLLWRSNFTLVMTPGPVDPELYDQLRKDRYHTMGVSVADEYLEDKDAKVPPLVFMGYELLNVVLDPTAPDEAFVGIDLS